VPEKIPRGDDRWAAQLPDLFLDLVAPEAQQRRFASREEGGEHEAREHQEKETHNVHDGSSKGVSDDAREFAWSPQDA
jgi:hypothetical protein